ncbi:TBC1 domain family member 2A isoform X1 [Osmerus mordax]|uniref:TBC1 domain family member 2A isoform X1 n=1 Tax=Osmerus mordax TaxID=8014 RepID=UPI00350FF3D7
MEVEGPEGNPSSAWSPSYPARAEVFNPADGADHITTPGSSEENTHTNTMGQSTLDHQSRQVPNEPAPSRGDHQEEERPAPDTADLQGREDQSPVRDHQKEGVSVSGSASSPKENHHEEVPAESTTPNYLQTIPPPTPPPVDHQVTSDQPQKQPPISQLCGYLHKLGGPLKAWKLRWFTYEEKKSQLFYYRTAQDVAPLGRVELCSATLGYPLKGETGTFHIQTPERTFVLKAANQEAMMYWLQQLQMKRWQHRDQLTERANRPSTANHAPGTATDNHCPDSFLPVVKMPWGLVGEEAASRPAPPQRTPLSSMSIKHPLIHIQNSVHSLRSKRSSQEFSQSVFHIETPTWNPAEATKTLSLSALDRLTPTPTAGPLLVDPAGRRSPGEHRPSMSPLPSPSPQTMRNRRGNSATIPSFGRGTSSPDRMVQLQQEKHMLAEEVKAQKELVWLLHKALEAAQLEKRTCTEFLAADGEQERLELLRHRERQAADTRCRLEEMRAETDELRRRLLEREAHVVELQGNIRLMMDKNQAKQQVIVKLSEKLASSMTEPRPAGSSTNQLQTPTLQQQDLENLRDDIEAYKTQNKFLNSEIHQLTKLWRNSSEQEKSLMVKCASLEASHCGKESRYLAVLRKLLENKALEPGQRQAVRQLISESLQGDLENKLHLIPVREHDEYGFKIIPDYEVEDMQLLAKIQSLEIRSHNLLHQEAGDHPLLSRWAQLLGGRPCHELSPSPELKTLLRAGVPREYRQKVWSWLVRSRTRSTRERHPDRYQQLCQKSHTSPHPASRQIQLDLHRTLTTNQKFCSPSSPALQQLERILLAFSWQNPGIGYCQGLNRLAAIALLVLQSEEEAFWCLVAVVEVIMPQDYYTKNLLASQADQRVLKDFMAEKMPRLMLHCEEHSVDVSLITFNWFLVAFVESLPSDILLRVWDAFLFEGTKVIFRYALALFKYKEEDILKIHDNVEIYQYLRFFTKTISDGRKLTNIAFVDMNPFPGRLLRSRRAVHLERLQGELRELEAQQWEFVSESPRRKDKDLDMVSEDEEEL